jgi:all-beta uncharacterized protein/BACON domain-containing protein
LTVSVARECAWTATSQANWLQITTGQTGQGDGAIAYRVLANVDPVSRRGSIAVGDQHADVAQDPAPCDYSLSAPDSVGADGGPAAVAVRTNALCDWQASSEVDWVRLSPVAGRGSASITAMFAPNVGSDRTATITIASAHVVLRQLAATPAQSPPAPAPAPTPAPTPNPPPDPPPAPTPPPVPPPPVPPPPPTTVTISGLIDDVSGSCPALSFTVADQPAQTSPATKFVNSDCKDVRNNRTATVQGPLIGGVILADSVEVKR